MDHLALKFAFALLLVRLPAFPYACATTQSGNWTSAATWTSCNSSIPGNGDTASIGHAVTVDANTTVGTSPSDSITLVLTINAPVTVAAAITLTVRGSITLNHNLILSAGSVLSMDPSQATIRLTAEYLIGPDDNSKWNSKLMGTACTAVARCTVQTLRPNGDEARARATMGAYYYGGNQLDVRYTDFIDLGSSSYPAWEAHHSIWVDNSLKFDMRDSTFTRCAGLTLWSISEDSTINLEWVTFASSLGTYNFGTKTMTAMVAGTRSITGSVFDVGLGENGYWAFAPDDFTIAHNIFVAVFSAVGTRPWVSYERNLTKYAWAGGSVTDSLFVSDVPVNPHFIDKLNAPAGATSYSGNLFQVSGTAVDGDCMVLVDLQSRTLPIDHTLILPNTGGVYSSCTLTAVGAYTSNLSHPEMTHNTLAAASPASSIQHGVFYNECAGACTPVGLYPLYKSNILQDLLGLHNHFIYQGTPNDNVIAGADVTNNTCWGCALFAGAGPANGTPYNLPLSAEQNVPGPGDVNVEPAFADPTRNVHTWAALKGQAASFSGMWTALAQDPVSRLDDLLNYLRAGFAPRNLLLAAAAHDGTYIGAVQPILMFGVINQ